MDAAYAHSAGTKRGREDDDVGFSQGSRGLLSKKVRPTLNASGQPETEPWQHDSVINTPTVSSQQQRKYDSDDQSSMVSEPGSPQDMADSSADDDMEMDLDDVPTFSNSPDNRFTKPSSPAAGGSPWRERMQRRNRVATPFGPSARQPISLRTGVKQHVRSRHPQELGADHLEVPSPVDEDEVPTPPSAAEAAGSQLSMLSVNDMDIETPDHLPAITVDPARSLQLDEYADPRGGDMRDSPGLDPMDRGGPEHVMVRKQRQRSGAQSNGSASPGRLGAGPDMGGMGGVKRGLSMGYRADCEKCRMHVPGHMNHFVS